jgi:adenylosuccinate synthase
LILTGTMTLPSRREAIGFVETAETIMFIEEIERVTAAPVSLISTRFDYPYRSIIDRRAW